MNLGSQTFGSILQSAIAWRILILSINNAIRWDIPLHSRQQLWEGEDNIPQNTAPQTFPRGTVFTIRSPGNDCLELGRDWLAAVWMDGPCWVDASCPLAGILNFGFPFVWMARLPTVYDNERCSETLLFHTRRVTYNFSWVTFDLGTDSLIYCPVLWFMSIFSE